MSRDRATYLWALSLWQKSELSHLGARCEQVLFHKRLYPKSRSTHEKLLKLISHYGSSNLKLPTPVLLPGKSHGWRSLMGCSPWGREESDMTERLHFHFSLSCIGEGNGNPLQCSCLENPWDRGAWWAAIYGVAQSQTQLKWLSSKMQLTKQPKWLKWETLNPKCW